MMGVKDLFGSNRDEINNLSLNLREASKREVRAVDANTRAIHETSQAVNALKDITAQLPASIADNMPKYSEREMRELKMQLEQAREQARITKLLEGHVRIDLVANAREMNYSMRVAFMGECVDIVDVEFSDTHVDMKLNTWFANDYHSELRKARRY